MRSKEKSSIDDFVLKCCVDFDFLFTDYDAVRERDYDWILAMNTVLQ